MYRMTLKNPYLGYYEGAAPEPAYDPGIEIDCFLCMEPLESKPRQTTSLVAENGGNRSYFYRVHKTCWENLSEQDQHMYEGSIVDNLESNGGDWIPPTLTNGLGEKVSGDRLSTLAMLRSITQKNHD